MPDWDQIVAALTGANGGYIAAASYVSMILIERVTYRFHRDRSEWNERDGASNVLNTMFNALVDGLLGAALFVGIYVLVYENLRLFDVPFLWWGWLIAFLLNDLAYYVDHRIAHRTGFFWALHIPHHSSREMNLTVSARGSIFGLAGTMSPAYFLVALLGVPPVMFFAVKFFGNLWGIFNHTRLVHRMGVLENWLCTPANHRVHHGTQPKYLDKNYGQTLLIWDRMFGSWQREEEEPVYGLVSQMESYRLWDIQTWGVRWLIGQVRSAPRWQDKLRYLYMPPGWRHDGCHQTTQAILSGAPACVLAE
jgi:sterol desaturase/sphingolipid hydroxylase (fatty acid hydroxylase superfamily)